MTSKYFFLLNFRWATMKYFLLLVIATVAFAAPAEQVYHLYHLNSI